MLPKNRLLPIRQVRHDAPPHEVTGSCCGSVYVGSLRSHFVLVHDLATCCEHAIDEGSYQVHFSLSPHAKLFQFFTRHHTIVSAPSSFFFVRPHTEKERDD
jgi:hypothetical protein